jgi:hypothetical protein
MNGRVRLADNDGSHGERGGKSWDDGRRARGVRLHGHMCTLTGASRSGSTAASAGRAATYCEEEGKERAEGCSDLLAAVQEDVGGRKSS